MYGDRVFEAVLEAGEAEFVVETLGQIANGEIRLVADGPRTL